LGLAYFALPILPGPEVETKDSMVGRGELDNALAALRPWQKG
jgi:hypothetical protein